MSESEFSSDSSNFAKDYVKLLIDWFLFYLFISSSLSLSFVFSCLKTKSYSSVLTGSLSWRLSTMRSNRDKPGNQEPRSLTSLDLASHHQATSVWAQISTLICKLTQMLPLQEDNQLNSQLRTRRPSRRRMWRIFTHNFWTRSKIRKIERHHHQPRPRAAQMLPFPKHLKSLLRARNDNL